ncbi:MAG: 50S ribosomal protein L30 [Candidatus Marinimicrobia bacterium]|jgi:large subunit ribosomal protein L30|nr:50S ribosomal protein L30 [Candidatus Neomarinimicrobiota bacterium]MBT3948240.1 50S ribosomal protein L30 [Candidatus Neomarinimicrobiota bacterium]MBT4064248.1 50S ribosomal protein L30 [Candidatus Neomarinimicrobiota bacterium]MBT4308506.1 50S ribosomal protein L30 [Candidatus Neomarinimicrobiota bacterium]MBT4452537.1 50S ribosomal protein L30 [Candidatus Neomarinimicrobiota bacterium]|tara:strand:- start:8946 stop:9131 length:186 start_codon:yes stop_codon:yes gene_type:complete
MAKEKILKITQIKSSIGYKKKAKATLKALGLRKMHQTVKQADSPALRGMINRVNYLVKVED